jgi:hypothetical protein
LSGNGDQSLSEGSAAVPEGRLLYTTQTGDKLDTLFLHFKTIDFTNHFRIGSEFTGSTSPALPFSKMFYNDI